MVDGHKCMCTYECMYMYMYFYNYGSGLIIFLYVRTFTCTCIYAKNIGCFDEETVFELFFTEDLEHVLFM